MKQWSPEAFQSALTTAGLSQVELGRRVGMSAQAVRAWLPPQGPRPENANRVADALGVPLDRLYTDPSADPKAIRVFVTTALDGEILERSIHQAVLRGAAA